ncbi:MAG: FAD-dependent oxidoreductase [Actinomycetaceae bacterium]|nr:FAD-dependent oxidoreductase [Actinomycetaceae bacterium]
MTSHIVVIGAGSAGSIISRRLVDAGHKVTLLEAGNHDINPAIHSIHRMGELWHTTEDWDYYTVPQPNANNRRLHLPRGRVLGGSHALNATIWVRGSHADYDRWADMGAEGWSWSDVEPYFVKIENYEGPEAMEGDERGKDGLLDVIADYDLSPVHQAIQDSALEAGLDLNVDYNSGTSEGFSKMQVNLRNGKRFNTWMAYAKPILDNENFDVITGAHVSELIIESSVAVGVRYLRNNELVELRADRVVLAAGALDSPALLMRSGIGPAEHLEDVGVNVVLDAPGVGENLHDHYLVPVIAEATEREIEPPSEGISVAQTHWFAYSRNDIESPDTQPLNFAVPMYQDGMSGPSNAFTLQAGVVGTRSRGTLRLSGPNLTDPIQIDLGVLTDKADEDAMLFSLRQCREIIRTGTLTNDWGAKEIYPGEEVQSEEAEREYIRNTIITYHHQVGTCRMGVDELAPVDPKLRLRGIENIYVADASVMPVVPSGNTNAPTCMIAERAADFIIEDLGA